jgi:hypothetical protein
MPLRISLSSPSDRQYLVADIFSDNVQVAEINNELGSLRIEIYAHPEGIPWEFSLDDFSSALNQAKITLQDRF